MKIDVLGLQFDNVTMDEALRRGEAFLDGDRAAIVVTPNAEIGYDAAQDEALCTMLNRADLVLPDGAGVVLAAKLRKTPLKSKVRDRLRPQYAQRFCQTGNEAVPSGQQARRGGAGCGEDEGACPRSGDLRHGGRLFQGGSSGGSRHQRGKGGGCVRLPWRAEAGKVYVRPSG